MASAGYIDLTSFEADRPARKARRSVRDESVIDLAGGESPVLGGGRGGGAAAAAEQPRRRQRAVEQQTYGDLVDLTLSQNDPADWPPALPAAKRRRKQADDRQPLQAWGPQDVQDQERQQQQQQQQQQEQEEQRLEAVNAEQPRQQVAAELPAEEPQQPCFICFEDVPAMMHNITACRHAFCLPCLREFVSGKVGDRLFPIVCPLPDCKKELSAAECGLVLTEEEQATLGKMEMEAAVGEGARLFCPNPKCSQLLVADDKRADTAMGCPHCEAQLCANCGVAWHKGMTCAQYQAQPGALRSKDDQALLDFAEKAGMKRCPACGVMVERITGCSYMSCRCGSRFCYGCGKRKEARSNHYCDCKPAAEQWLQPPAAMAAAQQNREAAMAAAQAAAQGVARLRQQQRAAQRAARREQQPEQPEQQQQQPRRGARRQQGQQQQQQQPVGRGAEAGALPMGGLLPVAGMPAVAGAAPLAGGLPMGGGLAGLGGAMQELQHMVAELEQQWRRRV